MDYTISLVQKNPVAEGTLECVFTRPDHYDFTAGQNTDWTLINPAYTSDQGNTHTFSFASSPQEKDHLRITTRLTGSAFKKSLSELPIGSQIKILEPMGTFTLHRDVSKPAVFLVGGIGITPFRSMIHDSVERQTGHQITMLYSNRTVASTAFYQEFTDLAAQHPDQFRFIPIVTDEMPQQWNGETRKIDAEMIKKYVTNLQTTIFYTAGPAPMTKAMANLVIDELGAPEEHLKVEEFPGY